MLIIGVTLALLVQMVSSRITLTRALIAGLFLAIGVPFVELFFIAKSFISSTFFYGFPEWFVYMCFTCMDVESLKWQFPLAVFVAGCVLLVYAGTRRVFEGVLYAFLIVAPAGLATILPMDNRVLVPAYIVVFGVFAWKMLRGREIKDIVLYGSFFLLTCSLSFIGMLPMEMEGLFLSLGGSWVIVLLGYFIEKRIRVRRTSETTS